MAGLIAKAPSRQIPPAQAKPAHHRMAHTASFLPPAVWPMPTAIIPISLYFAAARMAWHLHDEGGERGRRDRKTLDRFGCCAGSDATRTYDFVEDGGADLIERAGVTGAASFFSIFCPLKAFPAPFAKAFPDPVAKALPAFATAPAACKERGGPCFSV